MKRRCDFCGSLFEFVRRGSSVRRFCDRCRDDLERSRARNRPERVEQAKQNADAKKARNVPMNADLTDENNQPVSAKTLILRWMRG